MSSPDIDEDRTHYKVWQTRYESIARSYKRNYDNIGIVDRLHDLNLLEACNQFELKGRVKAREQHGDNADEGHDERIALLEYRGPWIKKWIAREKEGYERQSCGVQDTNSIEHKDLERGNNEQRAANGNQEDSRSNQEAVSERHGGTKGEYNEGSDSIKDTDYHEEENNIKRRNELLTATLAAMMSSYEDIISLVMELLPDVLTDHMIYNFSQDAWKLLQRVLTFLDLCTQVIKSSYVDEGGEDDA
ncbi:MAG: hypothetical protein M1828_007118 [Chrysothrix sp. TS-e1954]|nr:MAG: hypothetical protein M1828_007118 [Chrysothrix sp. TS-e1954]